MSTFDRIRRAPPYFYRYFKDNVHNLGYYIGGLDDGLPLPPPRLIGLVIGTHSVAWYSLGGMFSFYSIVNMLYQNGVGVDSLGSILDFGCGSGRVIRRWSGLSEKCEIWGTDYNPLLVNWCSKKLRNVGSFMLNGQYPPLEFPDDKFELVYSYSIFTHLEEDSQKKWIDELKRVTRPGGYLLITTHGPSNARDHYLPPEQMEKLNAGEMVILHEEKSGKNECVVYLASKYVEREWCDGLELVEYRPRGSNDASGQDMYLFRHPFVGLR